MTPNALKQLRQRLKLKTHDMAALLGYTERAIRKWENEENPIPRAVEQQTRLVRYTAFRGKRRINHLGQYFINALIQEAHLESGSQKPRRNNSDGRGARGGRGRGTAGRSKRS